MIPPIGVGGVINNDLGGSNVNAADVSDFSGVVTLGSTPRTLNVSGAVLLSGAVTATGAAGLTVSGTGNLTVSGVNTIPGGVTINGGKVIFARNESAGSQALTLTAGGAATFPNSTVGGAGPFSNAIVVNGSGNASAPSSAPATFSGPVTLNGGTLAGNYVTLTAPLTLNGSMSGFNVTLAGPVTVPLAGGQLSGTNIVAQGAIDGPGQLTVSGNLVYLVSANTHQGGTKVTGGTLFFADKNAFGQGTLTVAAVSTLSAYNTPMTGPNAVTNPINATGNFMLAPKVPVEFSGPVSLGGTIGTFNALYGGVPVVTSFTGTGTGGNVLLGDGHIFLNGANNTAAISTIANYLDLGASVLPGMPGPSGPYSFQIALDISALAPNGLLNVPINVATLNLQPGVTFGRSLRVVGGTISSSGGETFVTGATTLGQYLNFNVGAGGKMHLKGGVGVQGGDPNLYPVSFNGSGTVLVESNSLGAPVTVNAGRVVYNAPQTNAFGVTVVAGELGGSGTINSAVFIGNGNGTADALLGPGDGIGTLHTRSATFASDGVFRLELDSTARTADLLSANGAVQLGNALLSPVDLGGSVLPMGLKFSIVDNTSASATTGTFLNLADSASFQVGANYFTIDYDAQLEADGLANDVTLTVVPEPASWALLCVGTSVAGLVRRRKRLP